MSDAFEARRRFGEGPLSRAAALLYSLLVIELLLLVTTVPGLLPLLLLDRDASNLPLAAICVLPVGPAVSAALYAFHHHRADLADLTPASAFWRGYRVNFRPVLGVWVPSLLWLTIIAVNLAHFAAAAVPVWWGALLVLVAVGVALWGANALVITSLFTFRIRDVARLALHFLTRTPSVAAGNASLLIVAAGVTVISSEAVLGLLSSALVLMLLRTGRPMISKIEKEFTG